jgi:hypothetical protein
MTSYDRLVEMGVLRKSDSAAMSSRPIASVYQDRSGYCTTILPVIFGWIVQ